VRPFLSLVNEIRRCTRVCKGARVGRKLQSAKERQHLAWWLGGFGLMGFSRALHVEGFVRTLVVEHIDKIIELGLLLQTVYVFVPASLDLKW
jgi:hypothetical protein